MGIEVRKLYSLSVFSSVTCTTFTLGRKATGSWLGGHVPSCSDMLVVALTVGYNNERRRIATTIFPATIRPLLLIFYSPM
jgi:hypothetical protein